MSYIYIDMASHIVIMKVLVRLTMFLRFRGCLFPVIYRSHYLNADVLILWLFESLVSTFMFPEP